MVYGAPEEIRTPDPQIRSLVVHGADTVQARGAHAMAAMLRD